MVGGWMPTMIRMTHLRTQLMMSFVAGLMLGIAMLHLLPHATGLLASPTQVGAAGLGGIIAMFLLLRAFHTHQHDEIAVPVDPSHSTELPARTHLHVSLPLVPEHEHQQVVQREDSHAHGRSPARDPKPLDTVEQTHQHLHPPAKGLGWVGMLFGLGLHTLMDGVALAASVAADWYHSSFLGLAGFGTFLAVALHKPLDAFAITSVMQKNHWSSAQQNFVNLAFSLACPLGAFLFYVGATQFSETPLLGWGLAISAGFFICIALSDLLPEVSFHDHDRGKLTAALMLGVLLAVAIENLPGHDHGTDHDGHSHSLRIEPKP